jgi:hypothetical protein
MKSVEIETLPLQTLGLPTLWWKEIALFNVDDSQLLADCCLKQGIAILGIEGFRIKGNCRSPDMDYIADFSELAAMPKASFILKTIESARSFFSLIPSGDNILFEFVLAKP